MRVPASSSTISPPATVRLREMSPLPLTRSPRGASTGELESASSRLKFLSRARASRFLRKLARTLRLLGGIGARNEKRGTRRDERGVGGNLRVLTPRSLLPTPRYFTL